MAKWTFAESTVGLIDQGPNNSTAEHFKSQDIFSALVRESIQNSLDVPLYSDRPVKVKYAFGKIEGSLNDDLREVEQHVKASFEANQDSSQYQRMASFIDEHAGQDISYLKVADYNTTGMDYEKDNNSCGFYSFVESTGKSNKSIEGSGGSYGFGKAAYYEFSNTRSVLVSSRTAEGACAFRGCSMLCTHVLNGKKYAFSGFFDLGDDEPIQENDKIPLMFRRNEPGSDIYILHVEDDVTKMQDYEDSIVRSVLLNFWMAIYSERLVVSFDWEDDGEDEIIISKDNLEKLMIDYFPQMQDRSDETNEYCNPRPYYEAIKNAVDFNPDAEDQNCVLFHDDNLKNVGKIKFYLMRNIGTRDRYIRMRKRYMVIDSVRLNGQRGISGVLICEDGVANDFLKKAEPPAHDKWDIKRVENFKNQPGTAEGKAYKAINAIRRYASECVKLFFANASSTETEIDGLEDFLYSTEDDGKKAGQNHSMMGEDTGNKTDKESGCHETSPNGPTMVLGGETTNTGQVTIDTIGPKGNESGGAKGPGVSGGQKGNGGSKGGEHPRVNPKEGDGDDANLREIKDVYCKSTTKKSDDGLVYSVKIRSKEDLEKADIVIVTQGEDGEEAIPLTWCDKGSFRGNVISDVDIKAGAVNTIQFRFEDNIKHLISLVAYVSK